MTKIRRSKRPAGRSFLRAHLGPPAQGTAERPARRVHARAGSVRTRCTRRSLTDQRGDYSAYDVLTGAARSFAIDEVLRTSQPLDGIGTVARCATTAASRTPTAPSWSVSLDARGTASSTRGRRTAAFGWRWDSEARRPHRVYRLAARAASTR